MNCSICLDSLKTPVSTPCGHIHCEKCLIAHVESNSNGMTASCPTCRAEFCIATPDLRFVSSKHHKFIMPSVRRVFLDAPSTSTKTLEETITVLTNRVRELERDKTLLLDRCEAALVASSTHAERERDARVQNNKLKKEVQELRGKYDAMKRKCKEIKDERDMEIPVLGAAPSPSGQRRPVFDLNLFNLNKFKTASSSSIRPMVRIQKRPRLLGSPFDPEKAGARRGSVASPWGSPMAKRRRLALDAGEVEVVDDDGGAAAGSSSGSQSSRTHVGDIFSPSGDATSEQSRPRYMLRGRRLD